MQLLIQKLKIYGTAGVIAAALFVPLAGATPAFAALGDSGGGSNSKSQGPSQTEPTDKCTGDNIGTDKCSAVVKGGDCKSLSKCDLMETYVNPLIKVLAALVGVVVVISIIIGGIQYSSSAGDPQAAQAAQKRIRNAIIALVVFIFLYALLNFLVPGGLG